MSTKEREEPTDLSVGAAGGERAAGLGGSSAGEAVGAVESTPPLTVTNARGIPVPAMRGLNGGTLKVGNDVNATHGGRKPESIRIAATKGVEDLLPKIIESTAKQAQIACEGEGDKAARAHAEAIRGFRGLVEAGPGTKVTNVLERSDWIAQTRECLEECGADPSLTAQVLKSLEAKLGA